MKFSLLLLSAAAASVVAPCLSAQMLDPKLLLQPPTNAWPTFNGDYTGKRFSTLDQINQSTIKNLRPAWVRPVRPGETPGSVIGGEATAEQAAQFSTGGAFGTSIKCSPLMVDGVLYFTTPDNAWAIDARSGRELWHYFWQTRKAASTSATAASACTATGCSSKPPTTTSSRSMPKPAKNAGTSRSPT